MKYIFILLILQCVLSNMLLHIFHVLSGYMGLVCDGFQVSAGGRGKLCKDSKGKEDDI